MNNHEDLFGALGIQPGGRLKYEIDCRPWLPPGKSMSAVEFVQQVGDPVVYETPAFFNGNLDVQFAASAPEGATCGHYRVRVKLTDNDGELDSQWLQMTVG